MTIKISKLYLLNYYKYNYYFFLKIKNFYILKKKSNFQYNFNLC